jgi:hypothetical protein
MVLKAPLISSIRTEAIRPLFIANLISWIRQVIRFTNKYKGNIPNYYITRTLYLIVIQDILFTKSLSRPLPSIKSRVISL